jgi:hypothetical protein
MNQIAEESFKSSGDNALAAPLAVASEKGGWIKWTKENDPEDEVLIWTRWNRIAVARRDWEQGGNPEYWRSTGGYRIELQDVTHWMRVTPPEKSEVPA